MRMLRRCVAGRQFAKLIIVRRDQAVVRSDHFVIDPDGRFPVERVPA